MSAQPVAIKEPFGECAVSGDQVTVTPPHGFLSSRQYIFDRSRQMVTVSDRRLKFFGSKKTVPFDQITFKISQEVGAAFRIDMACRKPNGPLVVYPLTGYADSADRFDQMKAALTDGTGIDRWE